MSDAAGPLLPVALEAKRGPFDVAEEASVSPLGDHVGVRSSPAGVVTWCNTPELTLIVQMSNPDPAFAANAIFEPSGEYAGSASVIAGVFVRGSAPPEVFD